MADESKQSDSMPAQPGATEIDPRVALEEYVALAEFWRNRALLNGQRAFEQGDAINAVQEAHTQIIAENEELRKAAGLDAGEKPAKTTKRMN